MVVKERNEQTNERTHCRGARSHRISTHFHWGSSRHKTAIPCCLRSAQSREYKMDSLRDARMVSYSVFTATKNGPHNSICHQLKLVKAAVECKRVTVRPKDVMKPFVVIFSSNVVLLSIWTAVDPPQFQRIQTDELNSYGTCKPYGTGSDGNMTATKVLVSLLAIINIGALFIAQVEAFRARYITSEILSESKYISLAIFGNLQVFLIGLPLMFLVEENPSAKYFVQVGIIFVVCVGILLLIFSPKVWYVRHPPSNLDARSTVQVLRSSGNPKTMSGASGIPDPSFRESRAGALMEKENELAKKEMELLEYKRKVAALYRDLKKNNPNLKSSMFSAVLADGAIDDAMEQAIDSGTQ